jgi:AcrR family transcriptional regulator
VSGINVHSMPSSTIDRNLGLRERNKLQKRRRIYQVARRLFEKQGYDSTTMRQIARAADVGEGTVFLYAKDKRELLFRIFKDEFLGVIEEGFRQVPHDATFLDQLIAFMTPWLRFLQPHGALARIMVRESFSMTDSAGEEYEAMRANLNDKFAQLLQRAQERGQVRTDLDLPRLVEAIWANFRFYADDWAGRRRPSLTEGVARLREGLALLFEGIASEDAARTARATRARSSTETSRTRAAHT